MSEALIHPSAVIDPSARLAEGVRVGPSAVIGADVEIGPDCEIKAGAQIAGPSVFGARNRVFPNACLGFEPQDLKFAGEKTRLEVGDDNIFREMVTVNRGTAGGGGVTSIGDSNLFMAYTHVAHDCHVGNRTIFSNNATLAGHVEIGDWAVVGAFSSIQQFCRVGQHAFLGGYTLIAQDALPFVKTVGYRAAYYGLNRIGLQRRGFSEEAIDRLAEAFRVLVRSKLNTTQALDDLRANHAGHPEVDDLIAFVESADRGFIKSLPGKAGSRGGTS